MKCFGKIYLTHFQKYQNKPGLFFFLLHYCVINQYLKNSIKFWFETIIAYADVIDTLWQYQLTQRAGKIQHRNGISCKCNLNVFVDRIWPKYIESNTQIHVRRIPSSLEKMLLVCFQRDSNIVAGGGGGTFHSYIALSYATNLIPNIFTRIVDDCEIILIADLIKPGDL